MATIILFFLFFYYLFYYYGITTALRLKDTLHTHTHLIACAPTAPCLYYERYLLRDFRQKRPSFHRYIRTTTMASIADSTNGAASVQALAAYFRDLDSIQP